MSSQSTVEEPWYTSPYLYWGIAAFMLLVLIGLIAWLVKIYMDRKKKKNAQPFELKRKDTVGKLPFGDVPPENTTEQKTQIPASVASEYGRLNFPQDNTPATSAPSSPSSGDERRPIIYDKSFAQNEYGIIQPTAQQGQYTSIPTNMQGQPYQNLPASASLPPPIQYTNLPASAPGVYSR